MNPSKFYEKREHKVAFQIDEMEREAKEVAIFFDRNMKIWTTLEEDEKVQVLDQKEEKIRIAMQDLKQ